MVEGLSTGEIADKGGKATKEREAKSVSRKGLKAGEKDEA